MAEENEEVKVALDVETPETDDETVAVPTARPDTTDEAEVDEVDEVSPDAVTAPEDAPADDAA